MRGGIDSPFDQVLVSERYPAGLSLKRLNLAVASDFNGSRQFAKPNLKVCTDR